LKNQVFDITDARCNLEVGTHNYYIAEYTRIRTNDPDCFIEDFV